MQWYPGMRLLLFSTLCCVLLKYDDFFMFSLDRSNELVSRMSSQLKSDVSEKEQKVVKLKQRFVQCFLLTETEAPG